MSLRPDVVRGRRGLHAELLKRVARYGAGDPTAPTDFLMGPRTARLPAGGNLLDVGCGSGEFLTLASSQGWSVQGIEPHARARSLARRMGHEVFGEPLSGAGLPKERFDVVTFWDSLDLMEDPGRELESAFGVLKAGGKVWIRVRHARLTLAAWRWGGALGLAGIGPLFAAHRHGFGSRSLKLLLAQKGFGRIRFMRSPSADALPYAGPLGRLYLAAARVGARFGATGLLVCAEKRRSLRVLHLITRLDPGGSAETAIELARRSTCDGLASGPGHGPLPEGSIKIPHLVRDVRPFRDIRALWEIIRLLDETRPAVLHTHTSKAGILGRWAAWLLNKTRLRDSPIRTVHTAYGHVFYGYFGPLRSRLFRMMESATASITDKLVAISAGELEESLAYGVGRREQWEKIPLGADLEGLRAAARVGSGSAVRADGRRRASFGIPPGAFVVGTISRLEPVKGVGDLLKAAAILRRERPDLRAWLLIVGDGRLSGNLRARAAGLGLGGSVIFAGYRGDLADCLCAMDVYAQPSLNEGMGKALLLAQAAGLPAVASRVCGIPDVVKDGKSGILVAPGNPRELARALLRLAEDPGLRGRMAGQAVEHALRPDGTGRHFSPEVMAGRMEALYASLSR